jgi:ribosomal protein S3
MNTYKMTPIEEILARQIGHFYLDKQGELSEENCRKAIKELKGIGISFIHFDESTFTLDICLYRPGVLIGEKGNNIEALLGKYLNKENEKTIKIHIIEDKLQDFLFSFTYMFDDGNEDF